MTEIAGGAKRKTTKAKPKTACATFKIMVVPAGKTGGAVVGGKKRAKSKPKSKTTKKKAKK